MADDTAADDKIIGMEEGQVEFLILDFTNVPEGYATDFQPGWYFSIPMPDEGQSDAALVDPDGPYDTEVAARDAALAFIQEALTSYVNSPGEIDEDDITTDVSDEEILFVSEAAADEYNLVEIDDEDQ